MIRRIKTAYRNWKLRRWAKRIARVNRQMYEAIAEIGKVSAEWRKYEAERSTGIESGTFTTRTYLEGYGNEDVN